MVALKVAILGLGRMGASIGLALHRYMADGGKHTFEVVGYDYATDNEKKASKMGAVDRTEHKIFHAVEHCDIVVIAQSYEEVKETYRVIAPQMRAGVVVLDASPLKGPSLQWAEEYLNEDQHLVGITPIVNPKYLFNPKENVEEAVDDLFDNSTILLTPAVKAIKEAVDLAFNFCQIVGSKPRFLDPLEHDMLLAQTEAMPAIIGTVMFYNLITQENWDDLQWLTNPAFGVLTRPLYDTHPDALRDLWVTNKEAIVRNLDQLMASLQQFRQLLNEEEEKTLEAVVTQASQKYEEWINRRYQANWDQAAKGPETEGMGIMNTLFGGAIADRITGRKKDDD